MQIDPSAPLGLSMPPGAALLALLALLIAAPAAAAAQNPPLAIEAKIPLGAVRGRIDHLDIDLPRRRLFVAELGNDSLGIVDLNANRLLRTIPGFREPQGVGYEASTDTLFVANGGDGSVRLLHGADFAALGRIELGRDADNLRIDARGRRVLVGYGRGIAIIDAARRAVVSQIRLPAHPEGFQLARDGRLLFANLPGAHQVGVADLTTAMMRAVSTGELTGNFPMATDAAAGRVLVAYRNPPFLAAYTMQDLHLAASLPLCGDADDLFLDRKRQRIYASCGAGVVDVIAPAGNGYRAVARIPTVSGARTSLFVPELDRLYVAARASGSEPAAIWVMRPAP